MSLTPLDIAIVVAYIASVIVIGFLAKRKAAAGLESYFLGNRQMPWWMLAMSGSSSYFDITGTMWIVSILVVMGGFRGLTIVEFFQTIILTLGALMIGYLGYAAFRTTDLAAPPPPDWYSLWPVRAEDPAFRKEPFFIDLVNVVIAVVWLAALYTAPVLFVTHQMEYAAIAGAVVLVLTVALAFTWWPHLPKAEHTS